MLRVGFEFGGSFLVIKFDQGQRRVKLSTGLIQRSPGLSLGVILRGFSDVNATVLVAESRLSVLGSNATTIDNPIEVNSNLGNIRSVKLSVVRADNPDISPDNLPVVLDNLEYDLPSDSPLPDTAPPFVSITNPFEGQRIDGAVPGLISINLEATIIESGLRSVMISVNDHPAFPADYFKTDTNVYQVFMTLHDSDGLVAGSNTITLVASDFANNNSPTAIVHFTFTPKPIPPPSADDIVPVAVEVTQGIDAGPIYLNNPDLAAGRRLFLPGTPANVRLVQGKQTLIRVYSAASRASSPITNVPATMHVCKDPCGIGDGFNNNNPLPPMADVSTPNLNGITVPVVGTPRADPQNTIEDLNSSWNFLIPGAWTTQSLVLFVTLNSGNYNPLPDRPAAPECISPFVGECRDNNQIEIHLTFIPVKPVIVDPVLVSFRGDFHGSFFDCSVDPTCRLEPADAIATINRLNQLYPMQVSLGIIRSITVSPNIEKSDLTDEIQDRFGCGDWGVACGYDPSRFIMGLVPDDKDYGPLREVDGNSNRGNGGFWSVAHKDKFAAPHEMGHAIGFIHASCDHNEQTPCDQFFPYPHGGIGGYGFDFADWTTIMPNDRNSPNKHAHDFMSYGDLTPDNTTDWVSIQTWDVTIDDPFVDSVHYRICSLAGSSFLCGVQHASDIALLPLRNTTTSPFALTSSSGGLTRLAYLVSGHILQHGASLFTAYLVTANPVDAICPSNDFYTLEGLDAKGNTVTVKNFVPRESEDGTMSFTEALIVPAWKTLTRINLTHAGTILSSLSGGARELPQVIITAPAPGDVWHRNEVRRISWTTGPGQRKLRYALVEYSADGGRTSVYLARDVTENYLDVDINALAASTDARITVRVSDGLNTVIVESHRFTVEPKPPTVAILQPADGSVVTTHLPLTLVGAADDVQEKIPDSALEWALDGTKILGTGHQLAAIDLPVGSHTITLSAKNNLGLASKSRIKIYGRNAGPK